MDNRKSVFELNLGEKVRMRGTLFANAASSP
jgi:hypothetical protein